MLVESKVDHRVDRGSDEPCKIQRKDETCESSISTRLVSVSFEHTTDSQIIYASERQEVSLGRTSSEQMPGRRAEEALRVRERKEDAEVRVSSRRRKESRTKRTLNAARRKKRRTTVSKVAGGVVEVKGVE